MRKELDDGKLALIGIGLILTVSAFLRFNYAFFDGMWVDEGRYGRVAFELSTHLLDYSTQQEWLGQIKNFPPVYPYLLALSSTLLGKSDFAVRLVSPVMGTVAVGATYLLGREMRDRRAGLVAAALASVNPIMWFLSERVLIGATFSAIYSGTVLALYVGLSEKEYSRYGLYALGPLAALSIITKQPAYTLGILIPVYFVYRKKEEFRELLNGKKFSESDLYRDVVANRDYQLGLGLGLLTLLPWSLRSMAVCGTPLCGLKRAITFASGSPNPAVSSVQSTFFYIFQSPTVLTLPVAIIIAARVGQYVLDEWDADPDMLVKKLSFVAIFTVSLLVLRENLAPMALLTSIAVLARSDSEKLLWLWIGLGVGFMSIPQIKVPRYIIFVIPGLLALAAIALLDFSERIASALKPESVTAGRILVIALLPLLFISFTQGTAMVSNPRGFAAGEAAGQWIDSNLPEDATLAASSPTILRYYIYPRDSYRPGSNISEFERRVREKGITHLEVDTYERTQPAWLQTGIPPYRVPNRLRIAVRKGKVSKREALRRFNTSIPDYLVPLKKFGSSRNPLNGKKQPAAIVYRINRTEME